MEQIPELLLEHVFEHSLVHSLERLLEHEFVHLPVHAFERLLELSDEPELSDDLVLSDKHERPVPSQQVLWNKKLVKQKAEKH